MAGWEMKNLVFSLLFALCVRTTQWPTHHLLSIHLLASFSFHLFDFILSRMSIVDLTISFFSFLACLLTFVFFLFLFFVLFVVFVDFGLSLSVLVFFRSPSFISHATIHQVRLDSSSMQRCSDAHVLGEFDIHLFYPIHPFAPMPTHFIFVWQSLCLLATP